MVWLDRSPDSSLALQELGSRARCVASAPPVSLGGGQHLVSVPLMQLEPHPGVCGKLFTTLKMSEQLFLVLSVFY